MFDLGPAVSLFASHTITVMRPNADTYDTNGVAAARTFVTSTVTRVSVQPVRGTDLDKAPEGTNSSKLISLFAPGFELAVGDRVTLSLGTFEIFHTDPWNAHGNYSKALARELDPGEPRA